MRYIGKECAFKLKGIARWRRDMLHNFYITVRYVDNATSLLVRRPE